MRFERKCAAPTFGASGPEDWTQNGSINPLVCKDRTCIQKWLSSDPRRSRLRAAEMESGAQSATTFTNLMCGHRAAPTVSHGTRALLGSSMSAIGTKRISRSSGTMSAFGVKRTSRRSSGISIYGFRNSSGSLATIKWKEPRPNVEALELRAS
jgi:hypothetical protein